jgi:hypothetical protein
MHSLLAVQRHWGTLKKIFSVLQDLSDIEEVEEEVAGQLGETFVRAEVQPTAASIMTFSPPAATAMAFSPAAATATTAAKGLAPAAFSIEISPPTRGAAAPPLVAAVPVRQPAVASRVSGVTLSRCLSYRKLQIFATFTFLLLLINIVW